MTLGDVIAWVRRAGGTAFQKWSAGSLADVLSWHAKKGTMIVVEDAGAPVAVLCWSRVGERAESAIADAWKPDDPTSKRVYIAVCVGDLRAMWEQFKVMLPDWRECRFIAHRRGREVRYPADFADHLERSPIRLTHAKA